MISNEVVCYLLDEQIIKKCESCPLVEICNDISKGEKELNESTINIVKIFQFK